MICAIRHAFCLSDGNVIFDILEPPVFRKYSTSGGCSTLTIIGDQQQRRSKQRAHFEPLITIRNMMLISNVFNGWQSSLMIWAKKENDDPSLLCGQGAAMWVRPQLIGYHHNSQKSTVGDPFQDNVHCKVIHSALLATLQVILVQQNEQLSMHQYQIVQTALCRAAASGFYKSMTCCNISPMLRD